MDWNLLWKAVLVVLGGTVLLRFAGRKSLAQMTLAQVAIMIGIGSLLVQPVVGKNIWTTFIVGGVLVLTLITLELVQLKFDWFEKMITGKSKVLIENGNIQEKQLKKLRLSVDLLEMQLRKSQVTNIRDVQWATLEPNGQLGLVLKESAQPATKGEIQQLRDEISAMKQRMTANQPTLESLAPSPSSSQNLFTEVKNKGHKETPPKQLQ
jgi:uncharacterized membrane protein YcaP (DUF421 family)